MSKKGENYPRNMEELMKITYGNDYERWKKYNDSLTSDFISPSREEQVVSLISPTIHVKRIKKKSSKTHDYIIESEKVLIEVKGLSIPFSQTSYLELSDEKLSRKINYVIEKIDEKDKSEYPEYLVGGVIFISLTICFTRGDIFDEDTLIKYLKNSTFITSDIDFIMVHPDGFSINGTDSTKRYPPIIIVKDMKNLESIKDIFPNVKIQGL